MTDPAVRIKVGLSGRRWRWRKVAPPCAYIARGTRGIRQADLGGVAALATTTLFGTMAQPLADAVDLDLAFATGGLRRDAATTALIVEAFGPWLTPESDHSALRRISTDVVDLGILRIWASVTTTGVWIGAWQAATRVTTEAWRTVGRLLAAHLTHAGVGDLDARAARLTGVAIALTVYAADRSKDLRTEALTAVYADPIFADQAGGALARDRDQPRACLTWERTHSIVTEDLGLTLAIMVDLDTRAAGLAGIAIGLAVDAADRGPDVGAETFAALNTEAVDADQSRRTLGRGDNPRALTGREGTPEVALDRGRFAFTRVVDLDPGAAGLTGIAIGLAVDAADRGPDVGAETFAAFNA